LKYFYTRTNAEMLDILNKQINNEPVVLNHYFGIKCFINGATSEGFV
jgi:hypothetical protein